VARFALEAHLRLMLLSQRAAAGRPNAMAYLRADLAFRGAYGPFDVWTALVQCAVTQEQVDEVLVRHAEFRGQLLEIGNSRDIKPNGDLSLELFGVWVLTGFGKIVLCSHLLLQ
jgi:hypothetical protein